MLAAIAAATSPMIAGLVGLTGSWLFVTTAVFLNGALRDDRHRGVSAIRLEKAGGTRLSVWRARG